MILNNLRSIIALLKYPNNNIPKPNEILDDPDKYKKIYSNYILEIINESKKVIKEIQPRYYQNGY